MFNTQSDEFYTVLINDEQDRYCLFQSFEDAVKNIQNRSSWDCRPSGGRTDEWYDPASGRVYKIVPCDDCGRY
jgi:hypothetical protein